MNQDKTVRSDRLRCIDFGSIANAMRGHLNCYLYNIGESVDWTLVGFSIGGSVLTNDFDPGKSDLDAYLIVDRPLKDYEKGFWEYMHHSATNNVNTKLPETFSEFDFMGFKTLSQDLKHHTNQSVIIKTNEEHFRERLPTKTHQKDLTEFQ